MAQTNAGRDLLDTYQPGDRAGSQRIVRTYQNEVVRGCFLLTGDPAQAIGLARIAFLDFFRSQTRGAAADDSREALLDGMVKRWLAGDHRQSRHERTGAESVPTATMPGGGDASQRFQVDTERSRVLEALGRLDQPVHAALVLREFHLLDEETACRILDTNPFELRRQIQPARAKIEDEVSGGAGRSARDLLIDAATAAPRPDLWAELEAGLEDLRREEEERTQRYTYIAAAFVGLALILAAVWLFGFFPAGDDGASSNRSGTASTPTLAPTPTNALPPTAIPDIASLDLPPADVPGRLLVQSAGSGWIEIALYEPGSSTYTNLHLSSLPAVSPDGRWLVHRSFNPDGAEGPEQIFTALDSGSGERVWEASVPGGGSGAHALTGDTLYTLVSRSDEFTIVALEIESGEETGRWTGILEDLRSSFTTALWASPDGERLFVAIDESSRSPELGTRLLASFSLSQMTLESINRQQAGDDARPFPPETVELLEGAVTPDGAYIYGVSSGLVWFRNAQADEGIDLELPFSPPPSGVTDDLRWVTSNDGRYLYVIALARQEAAIIDLLGRSLVRTFPIDPGEFAHPDGPELMPAKENMPGALLSSGRADIALSPDGSHLYLTGGLLTDRGNLPTEMSQIWVVDLTTWRFVDRWEVAGTPVHIAAIADELYAYVYAPSDDPRFTWRVTLATFDAETGSVLVEDHVASRPEGADNFWVLALPELYRSAFGRLPTVDGVDRGSVELASTLPRAAIVPSSNTVPVGESVEIVMQVVDPVTGRRLEGSDPSIRFDPATTAAMRLMHESATVDDIILIPSSDGAGSYRASATIEQPGFWSVEVTLTSPDGAMRTVSSPDAIAGMPVSEATDGKHYFVQVATDPAEPDATAEEVPVRAAFVEVSTGDPLPVTADLLQGAPEDMQILFLLPGEATATARLERVEPGHYEGTVSLPTAGVWTTYAKFQFGDGIYASIGSGVVTVRNP